jgi:hypothetical protein
MKQICVPSQQYANIGCIITKRRGEWQAVAVDAVAVGWAAAAAEWAAAAADVRAGCVWVVDRASVVRRDPVDRGLAAERREGPLV